MDVVCEVCQTVFTRPPSAIRQRVYCSNMCRYSVKFVGSVALTEKRFWRRVDKTQGCWLWRGPVTSDGYGKVYIILFSQKIYSASRVAWVLTHGPIPSGMEICHHCDNPPCVRPEHLFLGTHADNMQDASKKKRFNDRRGENGNRAKLTEQQVREILALRGQITQRELARKFNVSKRAIEVIHQGTSWTYLQESICE